MPLTNDQLETRITRLESSFGNHKHQLTLTTGGGGVALEKASLDPSLAQEISNNTTHRKIRGQNIHDLDAGLLPVNNGHFSGINIEQALDILWEHDINNYNESIETIQASINTTRTGDANTNWTDEESSTINNQALYNLINTHHHDTRYIEPTELDSALNSHTISGEHDHRYYLKSKIASFLDTKSDKEHLHDDRYFTKQQADSRFFNIDNDQLAINLNIEKVSPKLVLNDSGTNGSTIEVISTDGNFKILSDTNELINIENNILKFNGNRLDINNTPVSLEGHTHDDRYFTQVEVQNLLTDKSDVEHSHPTTYYTKDEVNIFLSEKTNVGHVHVEHYTKEQAEDRFLDCEKDTAENLIISKNLSVHGRIDLDSQGGVFTTYNAGLWINEDQDTNLSVVIDSGNLDQVFINSNLLKTRRDLKIGGSLNVGHLINGINIENFKSEYDQHTDTSHAHHTRYKDSEAQAAVHNDPYHYDLADHSHDHDARYYEKRHIDFLLDEKSNIDHLHDNRYMPIETIEQALDTKSNTEHDHYDEHYLKSEIDEKVTLIGDTLENKADILHKHDGRYYQKSEIDQKFDENASSFVFVLSGEILTDSMGRATLPIPAGFNRNECHYMASVAEGTVTNNSSPGIDINRTTGEIQVFPESVDVINYMVIGIR